MNRFRKRIAPSQIIRKDFEMIKGSVRLCTSNEVEDLLLVQSIEGRAHNGHGAFNNRTYVNTTIEDIVLGVNRDPKKTKQFRQLLIDEIVQFVTDTINGNKRDRLVNQDGESFLRIPFLKNRKVNSRDVLRGLYIGGLRDNADVRKETEAKYNITIGCGECYLVDVHKMIKMGLDGEELAHEPHEDRLDIFHKKGLIIDSHEGDVDTDFVRYYYIRHRVGPGQSDDAAVIVAGILYNVDVALGVFLSDAIDTLEKYVEEFRDQDQEISFLIGRGFRDLQISMDDVYEVTSLCAIPESDEMLIADSSLRYLLSIDDKSGMSAIESHLNFIEGKPIPPFTVSYKHTLNTQFYNYLKQRLLNVKPIEALAIPELNVNDAKVPLNEIMKTDFVNILEDASLAEVVQSLKESKMDMALIRNKSNDVVGVVRAEDIIQLMQNRKVNT